jgi:hypothetical protein
MKSVIGLYLLIIMSMIGCTDSSNQDAIVRSIDELNRETLASSSATDVRGSSIDKERKFIKQNSSPHLKLVVPNTEGVGGTGRQVKEAELSLVVCVWSCGPSRSTLVTGLYTQQTWCAATYAPILGNTPPELSPDMPTYGKLFQAAGYDTPYMGKWHLSEPWKTGMARYGFDGITEQYSLDAGNLQGTYSDPNYVNSNGEVNPFYNDEFIAKTAASWLQNKQVGDRPWCLWVHADGLFQRRTS